MSVTTATIPTKVIARAHSRTAPPRAPAPERSSRRAVIYLRVSTLRQAQTDVDADGFSISAQREACYRKAAEHGADVIEEYVDRGETARKADRPELRRMLNRIDEL